MNHRVPTNAWRVPLAIVGLLAGTTLPVGEGCADCPHVEPEPAYRILDDRPDWIPGSGRVEVQENALVISYTTMDGSRWEIEYERVPEGL